MDLDLNILRSAVTLLSFAAFLAIVAWAYRRSNRHRFDEAADLPFLEDRAQQKQQNSSGGRHE